MNRSLSLIRYAKTAKGWRRGRVVLGKNGRLKPDVMIINHEEISCPDGRFQLVRYEGTRPLYTDVSNNPNDAMARFRAAEAMQEARVAAAKAGRKLDDDSDDRKTLCQYKGKFLEMHKALPHRSDDAYKKYKFVTEGFLAKCHARYPENVTQEDVVRWYGWMRDEKKYIDRTRSDYYDSMRGFLRYCGLDPAKVIAPPIHKLLKQYTKKEVTIYDPETVAALIAASLDANRALLWEFAYKTGLRDSELRAVTRQDFRQLNSDDPKVAVKERDQYGNIKDGEERLIELELGLAAKIRQWLKDNPNKVLVFGTCNDKPDTKMLLALKVTARRAGLNCGLCKGCRERDECKEFTLHRFRRTFTSRLLTATRGDLTAVMKRTGHSDMESVMRYLAPTSNVREALASAF